MGGNQHQNDSFQPFESFDAINASLIETAEVTDHEPVDFTPAVTKNVLGRQQLQDAIMYQDYELKYLDLKDMDPEELRERLSVAYETNQRLHRRCQAAESMVAQHANRMAGAFSYLAELRKKHGKRQGVVGALKGMIFGS